MPSDPKEALERLTSRLADTSWRPSRAHYEDARNVASNIAIERDALAAEVDRWHAAAMQAGVIVCDGGSLRYAHKERLQAAEAKLSALEEAARTAYGTISRVAQGGPWHTARRILGDALALLDPTAPVEAGRPDYCPGCELPADMVEGCGAKHCYWKANVSEAVGSPAVKRTMTINLTDEEMAALDKLAAEKDLKPPLIFRQALRVYQLYCLPEGHPERVGRSPSYGADRMAALLPVPPSHGAETFVGGYFTARALAENPALREVFGAPAQPRPNVSLLVEALKPFGRLHDQIMRDHGAAWFSDEGQVMRAALAYPVANNAIVWRHFRLAAEALSAFQSSQEEG